MFHFEKPTDKNHYNYFKKNSFFQNQKPKINYAILSAMPEELEFFVKEFANLKCTKINIDEFTFNIYDYQDTKILIACTGVGTTFATSSFTLIHTYFRPEYFLISGTAGGIKEDLKLRDVIIAEKAFEAEIQKMFNSLKNTPFENCLKHPLKNKYFPSHYSADPELLNICESLKFKDINLYKGTVASSNAFPAPSKELFEKIKRFNAYSIDMETSAFYQTAWLLNAKTLVIRGISNILNVDGTDEKIHEADVEGSSLTAATVLFSVLNKSIQLKHQKKLISSPALNEEAQQLIKEYNLQPHPEGGYFSLIYKSNDTVKPSDSERYNNECRSAGTSIYYLLTQNDYSAWHVLKSDEIWHFYKGSPLNIHVINKNGDLTTHLLGDPLTTKGAAFQICIKAGDYFAAENIDKNSYSLAGCTVSPGFEYQDFKFGDKMILSKAFPQHTEIINKFCRSSFENENSKDISLTNKLQF